MTSNSSYFDRIKIKPGKDRAKAASAAPTGCEHPGCTRAGTHRAPKGRGMEGSYWRFCEEHVREYNKTYNYFSGLGDEAVASFQHSARHGHRPTWSMGVNTARKKGKEAGAQVNEWAERETIAGLASAEGNPFTAVRGAAAQASRIEPAKPSFSAPQMRAFQTLDLEPPMTPDQIKMQYKALVKRFHPDANGGDRSREERFRNIVQAYGYLKGQGFC